MHKKKLSHQLELTCQPHRKASRWPTRDYSSQQGSPQNPQGLLLEILIDPSSIFRIIINHRKIPFTPPFFEGNIWKDHLKVQGFPGKDAWLNHPSLAMFACFSIYSGLLSLRKPSNARPGKKNRWCFFS